MWRELVDSISSEHTFKPPATCQQLDDAEDALSLAIPDELRSLLLESNGIGNNTGVGVMSIEEIADTNKEMRRLFDDGDLNMPFSHVFFFAHVGNGDMFFYPIQGNGKINWPFIFTWDHEDDSRQWFANNLETFVTKWYSGEMYK